MPDRGAGGDEFRVVGWTLVDADGDVGQLHTEPPLMPPKYGHRRVPVYVRDADLAAEEQPGVWRRLLDQDKRYEGVGPTDPVTEEEKGRWK